MRSCWINWVFPSKYSASIGLYFGLLAWLFALPISLPSLAKPPASACPPSVLSRVQQHEISLGETLSSIADKYGLLETTLISANPVLLNGIAPVGTEIAIPPFDGIEIAVPEGTTWQDLAEEYGIRADRLFEINGCELTPQIVFIPGEFRSPNAAVPSQTRIVSTYPLLERTTASLGYGQVQLPDSEESVFHSGVDLRSPVGTPVLAAGEGTVAFAGEQGAYGNLVVINHIQGWQTRYAHLEAIEAKVGQVVEAGTPIGTVGQTGVPDSAEPHLHFEVRRNSDRGWVAEDPELFLRSMF
jgi:murein DD-endopeptidase MepM/ murein hydrolase activator NlpD